MGKRLIIKGADFSANAVGNTDIYEYVWYTSQKDKWQERDQRTEVTTFNPASKYWALNDDQQEAMRNKPINVVRLIPGAAMTTLNLYKVSSVTSAIPSIPAATATFESGTEFIEVKLDKQITLGSNEYLVFDNGTFVGTTSSYEDQNFYRKVGFSDAGLYSLGDTLVLVDFGYKN